MSIDFGVVHYDYPGNSSLNTEDVYLISGFKSFELGIYQTTSADWFGTDNAAGTQYILAYTLALNETISAGFSYGQTIMSGDGNDTLDYTDTKTSIGFHYLELILNWLIQQVGIHRQVTQERLLILDL